MYKDVYLALSLLEYDNHWDSMLAVSRNVPLLSDGQIDHIVLAVLARKERLIFFECTRWNWQNIPYFTTFC